MKKKIILLIILSAVLWRPYTVWGAHSDGLESTGGRIRGDVNGDGKVDISDIVALINQIAGTASYPYADVNGDGRVDISDIVAVINIIASNSISVISDQKLVVLLKTGEQIYFNLDEKPVTTFGSGTLILTTDHSVVTYNLTNVVRYTYEGTMVALSPMRVKQGNIRYSQGKDSIQFEGLPEGERIEIYSSDGELLSVQESESDKPSTISFSGMPSGDYFVKLNDATYKFQKQ